ncbi:hypothetical protein KBTX_01571 [wastewater metagenome]|uniref:Uncharacterized protein n=2 Tax=unclassified sequences TaxID=12908 RepID=A0A5B8R9K3_9ZZZZ|nr:MULTISPECIES: hypothetical protein [Arhodomonas]MCS4505024.1 hypothetical protein [Arhodomonas aquaeolei]QEA05251.1 hypothetical protein KBTEX_01571 [uncultured organism]
MDAARAVERIIGSGYRLASIHTTDGDRLVALFKRLTLTTGRAVYHWRAGAGLYRLGIEHILIPRTRTPSEVLSYIRASRHFGIYVLEGFDEALRRQSVADDLTAIADGAGDTQRLVVFVGEAPPMPASLEGRVARVRHNGTSEAPRTAGTPG